MKIDGHHVTIAGIVVVGLGFIAYRHFNVAQHGPLDPPLSNGQKQRDRSAASGYYKDYSNMMNIPPEYYNGASMEGGAFNVMDYGPASNAAEGFFYNGSGTPWTLGHNGGEGDAISPGWTADPDSYSARVSSFWEQQAVAGSHN